MANFYAPQAQGFQGLNIGEILARGQRYRAGEQAMRRAQSEEDQLAQIRPLETLGRQLALRGQLLGSVETPEDYAAILPTIQAAGLPMADLPEDRRSTASQTFRRPEVPATSQARAAWMPDFGAPMAPAALPAGNMNEPGIAPEEIATTVQRRAQAGLPLNVQQKFQDADLGRQIQREELAKRSEKYATQLDYAERAADRADKRFALQETQEERKARLEREKMDLERERMDIARREANAKTERETPKIAGYEPIPGQTVDASSAKVARDAIAKLGSLETITREFREAYNAAKKRGVGGQIIGPDADRLNGIRQRMLLNLKEAENLGVLQTVDIQTMEPIVPKAVGAGAILNSLVGRNDPLIALDQFEREVKGRLGSVVQSHGYQPIAKPAATSGVPTEAQFNAAWAKARPGDVVTGPDGNKYRKGAK